MGIVSWIRNRINRDRPSNTGSTSGSGGSSVTIGSGGAQSVSSPSQSFQQSAGVSSSSSPSRGSSGGGGGSNTIFTSGGPQSVIPPSEQFKTQLTSGTQTSNKQIQGSYTSLPKDSNIQTSPLISKFVATGEAFASLGRNIAISTGFRQGPYENILKPFEYTTQSSSETMVKNPAYIPSTARMTIQYGGAAQFETKPYVTKQELFENPEISFSTTIDPITSEKKGVIYSTSRITEYDLMGREFKSDVVAKTIGTTAASIATLGVTDVYLGYGKASNPLLSKEERIGGVISGTLGIASFGLGVGFTFSAVESSLFKAEMNRIYSQQKPLQPYFRYSIQEGDYIMDITKAKTGTYGIGTAETNLKSMSLTQKQGNIFNTIIKTEYSVVGETSWRYNQGYKFISSGVSLQKGTGMVLPSEITGKSFSLYIPKKEIAVQGGTLFKGELTSKLVSDIKFKPVISKEVGQAYLGEATPIKSGELYLTKSMPISKIGIDTRTGTFKWTALTEQPSSRGLTKIFIGKDSRGYDFYSAKQGGRFTGLKTNIDVVPSSIIPLEKISSTETFIPQTFSKQVGKSITGPLITQTSKQIISPTSTKAFKINTTPISTLGSSIKQESYYKSSGSLITTPSSKQELYVTPIIDVTQKTNIETIGKYAGQITTPFPSPTIGKFGFPIGIPIIGFGLKAPALDFGSTGGKTKAKRRRSKYTPSFGALVFGIKGKKPKGTEMGIKIRPITKGFKWSFGKINI